jgi:hypothetical protein
MVLTIEVMEIPGAIDTDANKKFICPEETAPFMIEENSVSLDGIMDYPAGYTIFFLEF